MTYLTTSAPSAIATFARGALDNIGGFFKSVGIAMVANSTMQQRVDYVHALQAKSDEELAALKINREDIVHEVFKDLYYA